MDHPLTEIVTPSGYKVYINSFVSNGLHRQLKRVMFSGITVDPKTEKVGEVSAAIIADANEAALKGLLVKVIRPDGTEASDALTAFDNELTPEDGDLVMDAIDALTRKASADPKDSTTS